jgi:D-arabinose 1-dehydrogenase-like Zn-dependent alcohol dehydrogenase
MVMTAPGQPIEPRDFDEPRPGEGGAVLDTIASEVCGTDVHLHRGQLSGVPYPIIPGHVSLGRIREICGEIRDVTGRSLQVGERVTYYDVFGICGACWHCLVAKSGTRCPHRRVYGITTSANEGLLGGWSERIEIRPGVRLVPVPEALDDRAFLGGGCGAPTGFHAVERAQIQLGDTVVVQGSGPVGLSAGVFAQLSGATQVLMIGAPAARLEAARRLGVDSTLDINDADPAARVAWVRDQTQGRGADVVIEASGNPRAVVEGLEMLRDAGRYVIVGQYTNAGDISLNPHLHINRKHATILGCWGYEFTHLYRCLDVMARHAARFDWGSLVSAEYRLDRANEALADMEALRVVKAVIRP